MSIRVPPRWNQRPVEGRQRRDTDAEDRIDEDRRIAGWSLPEDPRERRRIRNRLIVLAAALPIVQLLRWLFR
ncbi:MAG TPA: hypothetical protein VHJ58_02185 [Vicinamibacterales bacterium]|jgi:hypothetical protein|nr:hypothetical protein [Vicinamibacterales bacterium]